VAAPGFANRAGELWARALCRGAGNRSWWRRRGHRRLGECEAIQTAAGTQQHKAVGRPSQRPNQTFQFSNLHSPDPAIIINNVAGLAVAAKAFGVPTILTTVNEERSGRLIEQIPEVFPDRKPINRRLINSWQDERIVDAVKKTGRKKVIMAVLWTEICLASLLFKRAVKARTFLC